MILLLLIITSSGTALPFDKDAQYILNGEEVEIEDHPWQGTYHTPAETMVCACILIGEFWAITPATCGGNIGYYMAFGSSDRNEGIRFGLMSINMHPNFQPGMPSYDISVLRSTEPIQGENISPGALPSEPDYPEEAWITGWGRTCGDCDPPGLLHGALMPVVEDGGTCSGLFICVYDGVSAPCGDQGGALSSDSTIYGMAGLTLCTVSTPSTLLRVEAYKGWICSVTDNQPTGC